MTTGRPSPVATRSASAPRPVRPHLHDHVPVQRPPRGAGVLLGRCPVQALRLSPVRRGRQAGPARPRVLAGHRQRSGLRPGATPSLGGVTTSGTANPVVGIAATPTAKGYWVVTANGGVSAFGDAKFYGDLPDLGKHVSDVVAIARTIDGRGYYLVGADGGFFTFGDAKFYGSLRAFTSTPSTWSGWSPLQSGTGYLLVGSDGGVFTFGGTHFYGSLPGLDIHVTTSAPSCPLLRDGVTYSSAPTGALSVSVVGSTSTARYRDSTSGSPTSWASPSLPMTAAIGWPAPMAASTASVTLRSGQVRRPWPPTCRWRRSLGHKWHPCTALFAERVE